MVAVIDKTRQKKFYQENNHKNQKTPSAPILPFYSSSTQNVLKIDMTIRIAFCVCVFCSDIRKTIGITTLSDSFVQAILGARRNMFLTNFCFIPY